ncbi:MAG: tetratricopeptide repeat protein [Pseudomonadota bacterium]
MKIDQMNALMRGLPFLALVIFIASCTSTPQEKQPTKSTFSQTETVTYQEALKNIQASELTAGELDKAILELNKLAKAHPSHPGAAINLATALYKSKKIDEASRALDNAKKINADIPEIYNLSGLIDVEKGAYNSAEKNYLAAIKIRKNYAEAHYNLALVYDLFYQDFGKATNEYEEYLTLTGNADKATATWVAELKLKQKRKAN